MQQTRLPYILIPLAAFIAIVPLLIQGCSCGHDFDFHVLNWLEAARQFTHGNLHPHWAYTPAYNAGEPRFVFYPPLSWTLGAILGLIFPQSWGWQWTPILYTWLALTAAGLSLFHLARNFTPPTAAALAAVLYTVNPYMLFTAYERTAYAELLAAAFIPLLLLATLRDRVTIPRIAIPIALLWLTNAPAAVMSCYALALITIVRLVTTQRAAKNPGAPYLDSEMWASRESATAPAHLKTSTALTQTPIQLALNTIAGTTLGLGLAAVYILPAAHQRRYVQIAMATNISIYRIQNNFLFRKTGDAPHDQVLYTASIIAVVLIAITSIAITLCYILRKFGKDASSRPKRSGVERHPHFSSRVPHPSQSHREGWDAKPSTSPGLFLTLTTLTLTITLLLTPITQFLWNHAPELAFLQFPWRFLAILAAVLALSVAIALTPLQLEPATTTTIALILAAALTYPAYKIFHQPCDPEDTVQARVALFHSNQGTDPTDEYTPINADNDSLAQNNPPYWLSTNPNATAPANSQPGPAPTHLNLNSPIPENLILNLRDYPAWRITLNGTPLTMHTQRDDGLITIPIPAGPSTISITYTQALDQTLGDLISLASIAILILILAVNHRKRGQILPSRHHNPPRQIPEIRGRRSSPATSQNPK